jgi:hypothetical protein
MIRRSFIVSYLLVPAFVGLSAEASANDDTRENS